MKFASFPLGPLSFRSPLLAVALGLFALSSNANAAVTITFSEVGGDVHGVLSGSLVLPAITNDDFAGNQNGSNNSLLYYWGGVNWSQGGISTDSGLNSSATIVLGDVGMPGLGFGYESDILMWGTSMSVVMGSISPKGTYVWEATTLAAIGLGSLTTQTVYTTAGGGDTIKFTTVPEPGSLLLAGLGLASALVRRRRA